jgi:hypothetical protein
MLSQPPATVTAIDRVIEYAACNPITNEARAAALLKIQTYICTNYFFTNQAGETYKNHYIAKVIEQLLRGAKCTIAWALQNMQYEDTQWIIHYTQPTFKLMHVIANRMATLGFPCENIALVNDPSMKKPIGNPESESNDSLFYPASGPINHGQFYGSKKLFLSGKIKPLQKLDNNTKIIIPLNYHLKSWLGNAYPTVVKNYMHILEMQGLSIDQVNIFFGMFDGMDANAPDDVEHIEFYREHEAKLLHELDGLDITVKRYSQLSKIVYYRLADEIIGNILIHQFDLIKNIFATDLVIYINDQGYHCNWNFQVHPRSDQRVLSESSSALRDPALYDIGSVFSNIASDPNLVFLNLKVAVFRKLERAGRDLKLIDLYAKFTSYLILNFGLQNIDWSFVAMIKDRMNDLPNRIDLNPCQQAKVKKIYKVFLNSYMDQTYLTSRITARPTSAASDDKKDDSEDENTNMERTVAQTETDTPVVPQRGITLFSTREVTRSHFIEGTMLEQMFNDIFIKTSPPNVQKRKVAEGLMELENKYKRSIRP